MLATKHLTIILVCLPLLISGEKYKYSVSNDSDIPLPEDFGLNIEQYLPKHNYPLESHEVVTEDGYILTMHRIPHGRNENQTTGDKPAVLLVHGLFSGSMDWVVLGPGKSLGLMLADAGYDVWLGNCRGNTWSRKHVTLDPDTNSSFWDFSWHEMGKFDLPAKIDYILNATGQSKLSYVGHSQGCTSFMVMGSVRPEYNDKINVMAALSPIAFIQNLTSPVTNLILENELLINLALSALNISELMPHSELMPLIGKYFCNDNSPLQDFCATFLFLIVGFDELELNKSMIPMFVSNTPAGSSLGQVNHYLQIIKSGEFRQYDYGIIGNLEKYGHVSPPNYELGNITSPMALFYSFNDYMLPLENIPILLERLPNIVNSTLVNFSLFNHLDYLWATDIDVLLNNDVVSIIQSHN